MANLFGWLMTFFLLVSLLAMVGYQLICFADLEFDHINVYEFSTRVNKVVMPEFVIQAVFSLVCLVTGHYFLFFLSLPNLYYNFRLYKRKRHLPDVTVIFNELRRGKKLLLIKLGYLIFLFVISFFWLLWTILNDYEY